MRPTYRDVEQAILSVPGVAGASIGEAEDSARERLRIRLDSGHHPDRVAVAVAAMLRQRFGLDVDPAAIRPRPAPTDAPVRPAAEQRKVTVVDFARPAIEDVTVSTEGLEVQATTVLAVAGRAVHGRATGAATRTATLRTIARATLDAVERLFPGKVKTDLDGFELSADGDDELARVTVTLLTDAGADRLIGVSLVRDDPDRAVVRATLDAVNRRVGLLLDEANPAG